MYSFKPELFTVPSAEVMDTKTFSYWQHLYAESWLLYCFQILTIIHRHFFCLFCCFLDIFLCPLKHANILPLLFPPLSFSFPFLYSVSFIHMSRIRQGFSQPPANSLLFPISLQFPFLAWKHPSSFSLCHTGEKLSGVIYLNWWEMRCSVFSFVRWLSHPRGTACLRMECQSYARKRFHQIKSLPFTGLCLK